MKNIRKHGRKIMEELEIGLADRVSKRLEELDPYLPNLITDYAFGSVIGRPGLDLKIREMITVTSLIVLGNANPQLEFHMRAALNIGVTKQELLEIIIQMSIYAGLPACMNGINIYRQVLNKLENED